MFLNFATFCRLDISVGTRSSRESIKDSSVNPAYGSSEPSLSCINGASNLHRQSISFVRDAAYPNKQPSKELTATSKPKENNLVSKDSSFSNSTATCSFRVPKRRRCDLSALPLPAPKRRTAKRPDYVHKITVLNYPLQEETNGFMRRMLRRPTKRKSPSIDFIASSTSCDYESKFDLSIIAPADYRNFTEEKAADHLRAKEKDSTSVGDADNQLCAEKKGGCDLHSQEKVCFTLEEGDKKLLDKDNTTCDQLAERRVSTPQSTMNNHLATEQKEVSDILENKTEMTKPLTPVSSPSSSPQSPVILQDQDPFWITPDPFWIAPPTLPAKKKRVKIRRKANKVDSGQYSPEISRVHWEACEAKNIIIGPSNFSDKSTITNHAADKDAISVNPLQKQAGSEVLNATPQIIKPYPSKGTIEVSESLVSRKIRLMMKKIRKSQFPQMTVEDFKLICLKATKNVHGRLKNRPGGDPAKRLKRREKKIEQLCLSYCNKIVKR